MIEPLRGDNIIFDDTLNRLDTIHPGVTNGRTDKQTDGIGAEFSSVETVRSNKVLQIYGPHILINNFLRFFCPSLSIAPPSLKYI